MIGTLAVIFGLSTLFFTVALWFFDALNLFTLVGFVVTFNILQWLMSPYLVDLLYRVREVSPSEKTGLYNLVEKLAQKSQIAMPRVMIADIPLPNAFAYGSPVAGTRIAVTSGLLNTLDTEEVEAVVGHELGHIRHNDAQIMMFVSLLPAIFYYLSFSLSYATSSRDRDRGSGLAAFASISMMLYFMLTLLSLKLSRLREYYADRHSVAVVDDGARKLSEGLAKIVMSTSRMSLFGRGTRGYGNFKALFIADPDTALQDATEIRNDQELVQAILSRKTGALDTFAEIFSTHPNIVKRLRALQELE